MIWARKGLVHLLALVLFVSLLGAVAATNVKHSLTRPDNVKNLVAESGIYEHAVSAALDQTAEENRSEASPTDIPLDSGTVQQAAHKAFSPELLQQNAEAFIDANYDWLSGKTPAPQFKLDLADAKDDFATLAGRYTTDVLTALPVCTAEQLAQIKLPIDPLSIKCRPPTIDPVTEGARVTQQIKTSEFLSQPVITADSLGRDEQSQAKKPYYQELDWAPKAYRTSQKLPLILAAAALVSALFIIVIAPTRRAGWRRIGVTLLLAGLILIATKFIGDMAVDKVSAQFKDSVSSQLQQPREDFLRHLESQLTQANLIAGIIFLVLALIILGWLIKSRQRAPEPPRFTPEKPGTVTKPDAPQQPPAGTPKLAPRPDKRPTLDVIGPARPTGPLPPSQSQPPLKPKPTPKPRRRLIQ